MRHDAVQKEKKKRIYMWEENSMCISEITNVDQFVECLQKSKNIYAESPLMDGETYV